MLLVDNFAGGGGASLGIERALGRPVDIAINHNPKAIAMHAANHPRTEHYPTDVWSIDPADIAAAAPVLLAWFSPDCTHFSKAKGSAPVRPADRRSRDLAWVVIRWAYRARPSVIMLENVDEFRNWAPLDPAGRIIKGREGETFRHWFAALLAAGYHAEIRRLTACDYGDPTSRTRLFIVARRDGLPIRWPEPTHGAAPGLEPHRTAADCLDWWRACPSIFLTPAEARAAGSRRPLAEKTLRRIARGMGRHVLGDAEPFVVPVTHHGDDRTYPVREPFRTVTAANRGEWSLVAPYLIPRYGEREGQAPRTAPCTEPLPTIVPTRNGSSLVTAFLERHGLTAEPPAPAAAARDRRRHVNAFLMKYYGEGGQWAGCGDPLPTVTARGRFGLVTVDRADWHVADIGMRMLQARELFRAQGFPDDYVIDPVHAGKPLTKTSQIDMCGNSVPPGSAEALVRANLAAGAAVPAIAA